MKHIYMLFAALTLGLTAQAQLPDGAVAPNFTATDLDGNEWELYQLLDDGKIVILDFYATWCGPCWSYKEAGILEEIWAEYGPDGTDEIYVFSLESDGSTGQADLEGTTAGTAGDWITGTPYPMFDDMEDVFAEYGNTYYPTIYTVCTNHTLIESGQADVAAHVEMALQPCIEYAPMMNYTGDNMACGGADWDASININNVGLGTINTMTLEVTLNSASQPDVMWNGTMATGDSESVDLGTFSATGNLQVTIAFINGESFNNNLSANIAESAESTTYIQIRLLTDGWPEETGWELTNSAGSVIESVAVGSLAGLVETEMVWDIGLELSECYSFVMTDGYGDGLFGSQWGANDGTVEIVAMDGETEVDVLLSYDGGIDGDFLELSAGMETTTAVGISENDLSSSVNVFPNPFSDNTNLTFTTVEAGNASVIVYNLVGERVIEMNLGNVTAGTQSIELDFASMEAGIYLVSLTAGGETSTLRVTSTH